MSNFIANAFMLPNDLIDKGYMAKMKGAPLSCYIFIVRKTRGWNKSTDAISISQFVEWTGYNKDTVLKGLNVLEEMGIISKTSSQNRTSKYTLTDNIIAVENLDSKMPKLVENLDSKMPKLVENLDSNLSKNSTHKNKKNKLKKQKGFSEDFEKFWSAYPTCKRKSDKSGAARTFEKYKNLFQIEIIISILEKQKLDISWTKQDGEFIPSPSVWLNQKQWENDYWAVDQPTGKLNYQKSEPIDLSKVQADMGDW